MAVGLGLRLLPVATAAVAVEGLRLQCLGLAPGWQRHWQAYPRAS